MDGRPPARGHDPAPAPAAAPAPAGGRPGAAAAPLADAFREHWPGVLATLARQLGDLQLAEDATQEAFATAASRWSV